jgi:tetratricopeptide (TPR) repeat protein
MYTSPFIIRLAGAYLAVAAPLAVTPAFAQTNQQIQQCSNPGQHYSPDVTLKACNALLRWVKRQPRVGDPTLKAEAVYLQLRGNAYAAKTDFDLAVADYTKAIADLSALKSPTLETRTFLANNFVNRGLVYLSGKKDYEHAIADETQAIKLSANTAQAYEWRGLAYEDKGETDKAITDFDRVIALDPKDTLVLYERARAHWHKFEFKQAIEDVTAAIAIDPKKADFFVLRCGVKAQSLDFADAIADCDQAIRLDPNNAQAFYIRGVARRARGDEGGNDDIAHAQTINPRIGK